MGRILTWNGKLFKMLQLLTIQLENSDYVIQKSTLSCSDLKTQLLTKGQNFIQRADIEKKSEIKKVKVKIDKGTNFILV